MTSSETVMPQRNNLYGHPAGVATRLLAFFVDLFTVLLLFTLGGHVVTFVLCAVLVWGAPQAWELTQRLTAPRAALCLAVLAASLLLMWTQTINPFLYYQF